MTPPDNTPPASFESIWTAETIQNIRDEFLMDHSTFLCEASDAFKRIWQLHREELRHLVFLFNPKELEYCDELVTNCLVYCPLGGSHRQARIDFLDHEIQRLTLNA